MNLSLIRVLVICSPEEPWSGMVDVLKKSGCQVDVVSSDPDAMKSTSRRLPNVIFKSFRADPITQTGLMERLRKLCGDIQFVFVSPLADVRTAMEAVHRGACDCLPWPCEESAVVASLGRALRLQALVATTPSIRRRLGEPEAFDVLNGRNAAVSAIEETLRLVAPTDVTVLIGGESGTGKELVARSLHAMSHRAGGPFVAVNCAALADSILESEFFGHVRGAFTGAVADKPGRFELARGGTLFLDEIGDLSPLGQADLLRVLEDGIFRPLGSRTTVQADARIVAATHRDLEAQCREGKFREDLFYRLNVITIDLPPLRERREDVALLATAFCRHFCQRHGRPFQTLSPEPCAVLETLPWPGNVRQLRNVIERMTLTVSDRVLEPRHLPAHLRNAAAPPTSQKLADVEKMHILRVLEENRQNRSAAAAVLGISRRALQYKLRDYGFAQQ